MSVATSGDMLLDVSARQARACHSLTTAPNVDGVSARSRWLTFRLRPRPSPGGVSRVIKARWGRWWERGLHPR